jgi:hypothetical protein
MGPLQRAGGVGVGGQPASPRGANIGPAEKTVRSAAPSVPIAFVPFAGAKN